MFTGIVESENFVDSTQHQLRLQWIDTRGVRAQQAHVYATGAEVDCCACGEQRGADHAGRATDDTQAAVIAFVAVGAARREHRRYDFAADDSALRRVQGCCIEIELAEVDLAAMISAGQSEQAGLQPDESGGVISAYRAAEHAPSVGIETAGHVEREHGGTQTVDS